MGPSRGVGEALILEALWRRDPDLGPMRSDVAEDCSSNSEACTRAGGLARFVILVG